VKLSEEQVEIQIQSCLGAKKTLGEVANNFLALDSIEVKPFKKHVLDPGDIEATLCEEKWCLD
jgi:hypothetical protein